MEWHRIAYFVPMVPLRIYSLPLTNDDQAMPGKSERKVILAKDHPIWWNLAAKMLGFNFFATLWMQHEHVEVGRTMTSQWKKRNNRYEQFLVRIARECRSVTLGSIAAQNNAHLVSRSFVWWYHCWCSLALNDAADRSCPAYGTDAAYLRCDKPMLLVIASISTYKQACPDAAPVEIICGTPALPFVTHASCSARKFAVAIYFPVHRNTQNAQMRTWSHTSHPGFCYRWRLCHDNDSNQWRQWLQLSCVTRFYKIFVLSIMYRPNDYYTC